MIISPQSTTSHGTASPDARRGAPLYRIECGDGTIQTTAVLPPVFVAGSTSPITRFRQEYGTRFYEIRTALGMSFATLEDFVTLAQHPAMLTSVDLPIRDWSIVVLNFLKRLTIVLTDINEEARRATLENMTLSEQASRRAYARAWRDLATEMRAVQGWVTSICNRLLASHWSQTYARLADRFDLDGIMQYQGRLSSLQERAGLFRNVLHEMTRPVGCRIVYDPAHAAEGVMPWTILLEWRHALNEEDLEHVRLVDRELKSQVYDMMYPPSKPSGGAGPSSRRRTRRSRPTKAQFALAQRYAPAGYAPDAAAFFMEAVSDATTPKSTGRSSEHGTDHTRGHQEDASGKIRWRHRQTDLVFIMDACKEAGLFEATDWKIIELFDYDSEALDRAKTYRDTRSRIKIGKQHPDRAMLERLIAILQRGLR